MMPLLCASTSESVALDQAGGEFLWALAGVLLGGALTYIAVRVQTRSTELQAERDRLLNLRTDAFHSLWTLTKDIRRNPDDVELMDRKLSVLIDRLDSWYFEQGGMLLTDRCRERYFDLLDEIQARIAASEPREYASLYAAASNLRASLAIELGTRKTLEPGQI